jgi:4-amino-4-deoxy-L-arabinose transferase-like glycosyltransferase
MESPAPAPRNSGESVSSNRKKGGRRKWVAFALVFLAAFGVRALCWQDARAEAPRVQTAVTNNYKHLAALLRQNGAASFFEPSSPTNDPDLLGHPPGYPFLLALLYGTFGESDAAAQFFQIVCDSLAAALVLLIASELLSFGVGVVAGLLVALAPQFCWNSVLLLPDTLAVLPVLLAVYLLIRARERCALVKVLFAGALVGVSCWLRANALLLAPFLLLLLPFLFERGRRARAALALVGGAILAVAPLTARNAVVYGRFIPASLGAGQTLVEGIGDYDAERRFGLPDTDVELIRQEAEAYGRPEYADSLFTPDGITRDRARTSRALAVIRSHPFWFASVMARRAASMLRLERTPLTSTLPAGEGRTRAPRLAVRALQKLFVTALDLPLVLAGIFFLARARKFRALAALVAVPLYYLCVQSALHTEYRYVLAVHYFLFVLAAAALYHIGLFARRRWPAGQKPDREGGVSGNQESER